MSANLVTPAVLATRESNGTRYDLLFREVGVAGGLPWSVVVQRSTSVRHDHAGSFLNTLLEVVVRIEGQRPSTSVYGAHQIANALNAAREAVAEVSEGNGPGAVPGCACRRHPSARACAAASC